VLARPEEPEAFPPLPGVEEDADSRPLRTDVVKYVVQSGDTLWSIAANFGLDVDSLRWSNPAVARNPDALALGQELNILPLPGAYVETRAGDTLESLAERWGVAPQDISGFALNGLEDGRSLTPGNWLVIPYGRQDVKLAPPGPSEGYDYAWPIRGQITQRFSSRHRGVDLGAPYGAKVYAARSGTCITADWSAVGYGYLVVIRHEDGSLAYYSHLKGGWVVPGQWVRRGELLGEVGSTGNSTGPHVHFEIRVGGVARDPMNYLPPTP
jgi:murein DD-endopeptidase MepM/ murein hydrolase activator NlpD